MEKQTDDRSVKSKNKKQTRKKNKAESTENQVCLKQLYFNVYSDSYALKY